jgi:hypothetical protein
MDDNDIRSMLRIPAERIEAVNAVLLNPDSRVIGDFLSVVNKYGSPDEINRKAAEAGSLESLMNRVKAKHPAMHATKRPSSLWRITVAGCSATRPTPWLSMMITP